jgi:hypothetical protein
MELLEGIQILHPAPGSRQVQRQAILLMHGVQNTCHVSSVIIASQQMQTAI